MAVVAMGEEERDVNSLHLGFLLREKLIPAALGPEERDVRLVVGDRRDEETSQEKREQLCRGRRSIDFG